MGERKGTKTQWAWGEKSPSGTCGEQRAVPAAHAKDSQGYWGDGVQVMLDINAHRTKVFNTASLTYAAL